MAFKLEYGLRDPVMKNNVPAIIEILQKMKQKFMTGLHEQTGVSLKERLPIPQSRITLVSIRIQLSALR